MDFFLGEFNADGFVARCYSSLNLCSPTLSVSMSLLLRRSYGFFFGRLGIATVHQHFNKEVTVCSILGSDPPRITADCNVVRWLAEYLHKRGGAIAIFFARGCVFTDLSGSLGSLNSCRSGATIAAAFIAVLVVLPLLSL
jgi:hypothetical protein